LGEHADGARGKPVVDEKISISLIDLGKPVPKGK
jgi:hypothetical protein